MAGTREGKTKRYFRRFLFCVACLVTLIALAYAVENWRGIRAWEKHRAQWEAKGEKFGTAPLIPPPVPDNENLAFAPLFKPVMDFTTTRSNVIWNDTNGLERLQRISASLPRDAKANDGPALGSLEKGTFADISTWKDFYVGNTNYLQALPSATAAETTLKALSRFDPEMMELREAAGARHSTRFPIRYDFEPPWAILLPHLARMKVLVTFLNVRAVAELEAGHADDAFADLKLAWRLADGIANEPLLIDHLVRIACVNISLQTVREGLARHAWSEAQLVEIERYLGSLNLLAELELGLRGEMAFSTAGLDYMRRQGFFVDPIMYMATEDGNAGMARGFNVMPSGWYYQNMLTISEIFHGYFFPTVDEKGRRVYPGISDKGNKAINSMRTGPYTIFAKLLLPALERAARKSSRIQVSVDEGRVACALERYRMKNGSLPETLEALTPSFIAEVPHDVIDGKPLRYRKEADGGYLLYSVGWNQTDDNGQIVLTGNGKTASVDIMKGDWVWKMPGR